MPTYIERDKIRVGNYRALIQASPCFNTLSDAQSRMLAQLGRAVSFKKGEVIVTQDELVDSVYFIVHGEAEVTFQEGYKKKKRSVPIDILREGESIGLNDTGFFSLTGRRTATVTALNDLLLLRIDLKDLHVFLQENNFESKMYQAAEQMLRMQLIKQSLPFSKISHERLQWLCQRVEEMTVPKGTVIFHQGDQGDKCYLIRSGKVEILVTEADGGMHQLVVLKPLTLFGEATFITKELRNATACAIEESKLLAISYDYLTELWEKEQKVVNMFMTLMVERSRPIRNPKIHEYPRSTADGRTIVILKNPEVASYFKLSQEGWYLWQQMNGQQTLLEITMALANQYKIFSPNIVAALISKLAQANFIDNVSIKNPKPEKETTLKKWIRYIVEILQFRWIFKKADYWVTVAYNGGVRFIFTRLGQILLATVTILGLAVFLKMENYIVGLLRTLHASWFLYVSMIPLTMLMALLHELGHAFSTKACGREVHSMGVGWYWTVPVAFTDITDMWLDTRWRRIGVNAAGIYTNAFVAGICALLILVVPFQYVQAFLWLFALTTYIRGLAMLNPSQDMDGYYILMDLFEQPHLRHKATAWIIKKFPASFKNPSLLLQHGPEIFYWVACIIFLVLTAIITLYVQGFVLKLLGMQAPNLFSALILPMATVILSSLTLIADIRKQE